MVKSYLSFKLAMGVVKNIIPAVAFTNALVSVACSKEAFKILTDCKSKLNNYMQYWDKQTSVSSPLSTSVSQFV